MKNSILSCTAVLLCILLTFSKAHAQTPGLIVRPAGGPYSSVLDPNTNGFTSPTTSGFVTTDVGALYSEIPYKIIPPFKLEPTSDLMRGPSDKFTDLVRLNADESGMYVYNDGTNMLFRLRLGDIISGSKGYSILIDADQKFGAAGPYADPNYQPATTGNKGNPGFEFEVVLETNFQVAIYNADGTSSPVLLSSYGINTNSQISLAYSTVSGTPDYFYDFYVPLSALTSSAATITGTTPIRISGTTVMSPQAAIGGPKSDIYGYDGTDYMAGWEAVINGQSAFTPNDVKSTGTGLNAVCTAAPTLNSPINAGTVTLSGTWTASSASHAASTAVITIYRNGVPLTTKPTVTSGGTWTLSGVTAAAADVFYAKALSTGESECLQSNSVQAIGCSTASTTTAPVFGCIDVKGVQGTKSATATVKLYRVEGSNLVELTPIITKATDATFWGYDGSGSSNATNLCSGGSGSLGYGQYMIVASESGKCDSKPVFQCLAQNNTSATTTAPVVTQTTLYPSNTVVSGTATTGQIIRLYINGTLKATQTAAAGAFSFTGMVLSVGDQIEVMAQGPSYTSGNRTYYPCFGTITRTVTCFTNTPVIATNSTGNLTGGATAITGTATYVSGTATAINLYNSSNVSQGSATVQSDGSWSVTVAVTAGTSYYATATKGTCGVSTASGTITALTATTNCATISGSYTETSTTVTGTLSAAFSTTGTVYLYQDGVTIGSTTVSSGTTWSITSTANTLYPGGLLTATTQASGAAEKINCTGSVTISCAAPTAPTLIQTTAPVINASGQAFFVITNSQSGVLYTLEDAIGVDKSKSVFGNGGSITLTSYSYLTPGTYPLKITALKLTSSTCATANTVVAIVVNNNDGDNVADVIDLDDDNDGILDTNETTTYEATADGDGDGIPNFKDASPGVTGLPTTDSNSDGILDYFDTDRDGIINNFDLDSDNDGLPDIIENGGADIDNDGKVDNTTDADLDGLRDGVDANTSGASGSVGLALADFDGDSVPNFKDLDSDGNGVIDTRESGLGLDANFNGLLSDETSYVGGTDGWSDAVDALAGPLSLRNTDGIGKADYLDIDNDDDGIVDNIEARTTASTTVPLGTDTDGDGIDDAYDNVSTAGMFGGNASNGLTPVNTDGDGQGDYRDTDSDNDGFPDAYEGHDTNGDNLPNSNTATKNGIGGTADVDGDGLLDGYDNNTAAVNPTNGTTPLSYPNIDNSSTTERDWREADDADGDGVMDTVDLDDDNDGIPDIVECGGIAPDGDADGDALLNYLDPIPGTGIPTFVDVNGDGISDAFDADKDGILNSFDLDSDNDGVPDVVEASGVDANGDGRIDTFTDTDGDGLSQNVDANNTGSAGSGNGLSTVDFDGDGVSNFIDLDSDNDGIPDVVETGGVDVNGDGRIDGYSDSDGDGFDSRVDGDANNDGMAENTLKALLVTGTDTNNDGKADSYPQGIANTDGRGKPNFIDLDSDDDGIADLIEAGSADSDNNGKVDVFADADSDGFADARDGDIGNDGISENLTNVLIPTGVDANSDGKADSYTKGNADGDSLLNPFDLDADNDGIPDLIEAGGVDSNGDGLIDNTTDANSSGWVDSYEPAQSGINLKTLDANGATTGGSVFDFDGDGIANYMDLDSDGDGIPDLIEQGGTDSNNDGKVDISTDADKDGFADNVDPLNTSTGTALGTALITTGSAVDATTKLPASYSTRANLDSKGLVNMLDLDSDDDGISDLREGGFTAYDTNSSSVLNSNDAGYADANSDGWSDAVDALSSLGLPNTDNDNGSKPNYLDLDSDNDGIPDNIEARTTASTAAPLNTDSDADGLDDQYDVLSGFGGAGISPVNTDGDAALDYVDMDSDNDGVIDRTEGWDANGDNRISGSETAYIGTSDADSDGLLDEYDNNDAAINPTNATTGLSYPNMDNPATQERDWREATDTDGDGITDNVDIDSDNDGIPNTVESGGVNPLGDADSDGILNYLDPSPGAGPAFVDANGDGISDAFDADNDGIINALDLDSDGDGIADLVEAGGIDTNGDGRVDYTGTFATNDNDNDGLVNRYDVSTGGTALGSLDSDGDGIKNSLDLDSDGDGIPDVVEVYGTDSNNDGRYDATSDSDGDGWSDAVDGDADNNGTVENSSNVLILTGTDNNNDGKPDSYVKGDFDEDGIANPYELDSDGDGILDIWEAGFHGYDTNNNGFISSTDAGYTDTNSDGWSDAVDALASLNLPNTDGAGKANFLDIDADDDGITDNVEGQPTASYVAPSGTDSDGDGIDNQYDNLATFGGSGITPVNTDGADNPDYTDTDSDNDNDADTIEGNDLNANRKADDVPVSIPATDTDGDGLLDFFESNINSGPSVTIAGFGGTGTTGKSTAQKTLASATDRDWRNASFSLSVYTVLPVRFVSITASTRQAAVTVAWTVAGEQNVKYYEVERSTDGGLFVQIGTVAYKTTTAAVNEYRFVDETASGLNVAYRIRQVDEDGSSSLSKVVLVKRTPPVTKLLLYPNPVHSTATLRLAAAQTQPVLLRIADLQGRVLASWKTAVQKGTNMIPVGSLQSLAAGTYILIANVDGMMQQVKFTKE